MSLILGTNSPDPVNSCVLMSLKEPLVILVHVHALKEPVVALCSRRVEVAVGVGPRDGGHTQPAEVAVALGTRHLVTAVQLLKHTNNKHT